MNIITVQFRDDTLFAVEFAGAVYVAVTPICETLGLRPEKQRERIKRDPILSEGSATMAFPSPGGAQESLCLRLDLVHGWLFTLDESRVRDEETREKVLAFKRDCYRVLAERFLGRASTFQTRTLNAPPPDPRREESVAVRRGLVTEARHTFSALAARELWFTLGLPVTPAMTAERVEPEQTSLFHYTAVQRQPEPESVG